VNLEMKNATIALPQLIVRDGGAYHWTRLFDVPPQRLPDTAAAIAGEPQSNAVFTEQVMQLGTSRRIACSQCGRGNRRVSGRKMDCTHWHCSDCADYDMCSDCYFDHSVAHVHRRDAFDRTMGGAFFEVRLRIGDLKNGTMSIALVSAAVGEELFHGRAKHGVLGITCEAGGDDWQCDNCTFFNDADVQYRSCRMCGAERSATAVVLSPTKKTIGLHHVRLAANDEVWVRLSRGEGIFFVNGKAVHRVEGAVDAYRCAVRFDTAGQSVTLLPPHQLPGLGAAATVTSNAALLSDEAALCGLNVRTEFAGQHGTLVDVDTDGTVAIATETSSKMWIPRVCCESSSAMAASPVLLTLPVGTPVMRNPGQWALGDRDGQGKRGIVTATSAHSVTVQWPDGSPHQHLYGESARFDVMAVPTPGDTVVRNPLFWAFKATDGNGTGVVTAVNGSTVAVKWRAGGTGDYTFDGKCQHVQTAAFGDADPVSGDADFPIKPLLADAEFHLVGKLTAIDVTNHGKLVTGKRSCRATVCSSEVFAADADFSVSFTVLETKGSYIGFGVLSRDDTRAASEVLAGQKELPGSVAVLLSDGKVQVLFNDAFATSQPMNTAGATILTMRINGGSIRFSVDGASIGHVDFADMKKKGGGSAGYRLGVSLSRAGQRGVLLDAAAIKRQLNEPHGSPRSSRGVDARAVSVPFDGEFTFHDRFTSMDATDGGKLATCVRNHEATCYTREVFDATATVEATLSFGNFGGEPVTFGLMPSNATKECASGVLGVMDGTVGCRLHNGEVQLYLSGKRIFNADYDTTGDQIRIVLQNGELSFSIGRGSIRNRPEFSQLRLGDQLRFGASLGKAGQTARFMGGNEPSSPRSAPANFPCDALANGEFHLVDRVISIGIEHDGKVATCKATRRATVCSAEVFSRNADWTVDLSVMHSRGSHIGLGILCRDDTRVANKFLLGEKEIPGSVGVLLAGGKVRMLYRDKFRETKRVNTEGVVVLTMAIREDAVSFFADGDIVGHMGLSELQGGDASGGYRLGVSMSTEGQLCALMGAQELINVIGAVSGDTHDVNESRVNLLTSGTGFAAHDWETQAALGDGSYGVVYKIRHTVTGAVAARKDVNLGKVKLSAAQREVDHMMALAHRNVVKVFASAESKQGPKVLHIYMELCDGGPLSNKLKTQSLTPEDALSIARDIVQGLVFIHSRKIVHRDVKPENILLCKGDGKNGGAKFVAKLGDLGQATDIANITHLHSDAGTMLYNAPEMLDNTGYDAKADVWAAACVLYELVTGHVAFAGPSVRAIVGNVTTCTFPPISADAAARHPTVSTAVTQMLQLDADDRPSADDVAALLGRV
jgi:hypothetical protein